MGTKKTSQPVTFTVYVEGAEESSIDHVYAKTAKEAAETYAHRVSGEEWLGSVLEDGDIVVVTREARFSVSAPNKFTLTQINEKKR